jgi:general secretion pathway protein A
MYTAYFGLRENPFSITPDPSYLYLSPYHQEALAHLLYGTGENGGFVQLTGEVGTGKTTLIRTLLEQHIENVDVALCLNPCLTVEELVATVCDELQVSYPRSTHTLKLLLDTLNTHLLTTHAQGRRTVLIIDEAQNLSREVLEQVRLLTNLETHRHKLLRIILVGQPELQQILERKDLRQLAQRITARYHLMPLRRKETTAYILHRIRVAGGHDGLFSRWALRAVHRLSRGIPRLINTICDRALLGAYGRNRKSINATVVRRASQEILRGSVARPTGLRRNMSLRIIALGGLVSFTANPFSPTVTSPAKPLQTLSIQPIAETTTPSTPPTGQQMATTAAAIQQPSLPDVADPVLAAAAPVNRQTLANHHSTTSFTRNDLVALLLNRKTATEPVQRLLAVWRETPAIPPGVPPCEQVKRYQLRCLSGHGDWHELRRYNRPVMLTLQLSENNTRHDVLLRTLENDTATLQVTGRTVPISLDRLDGLWTGDYLMLWRLQTSLDFIAPGFVGEPVVWLRQRLALAKGQDPTAQSWSKIFDAALRERVQEFQRANALQADGIVGRRTMALLNNLAPTPATPLLSPPAPERID